MTKLLSIHRKNQIDIIDSDCIQPMKKLLTLCTLNKGKIYNNYMITSYRPGDVG